MVSRVLALTAFATLGLPGGCKRTPPNETSSSVVAKVDAADSQQEVVNESSDASMMRAPRAVDPFGVMRTSTRGGCGEIGEKHVAAKDLSASFVDGSDLLALVNRSPTGQLAPDWAPDDLVDIRNGKSTSARECEKLHCLRKDSADALSGLLEAMKAQGFVGKVESAYRSYGFQCGTFLKWAEKADFCDATEQSALPGHSQHQLGTTVDLFTDEWAKDDRGVFREGFGCTPAGKFIQERAGDFGFVLPYPIHPDDRHPKQSCVTRWDIPIGINPRTGYRFEHWHLRYVGKDAASRFKTAWTKSNPGGPDEIAFEQWLRHEKGIDQGDAELPVCDGCNCGACATLAPLGKNTCDRRGGALHLDEHGLPLLSDASPQLRSAKRAGSKKWRGHIVEVGVGVPDGLATQPPIVGLAAAGYAEGSSYAALSPYPETRPRAFAPLASAWTIGVEPVPNTGSPFPWRAALAAASIGQIYNRANVLLPALPGTLTIKVPVPKSTHRVIVRLLKGGVPQGDPISVELR